MEVAVYPDAVGVIVSHLRSELTARSDTATVATVIPSARPSRFVLVRRVGGPRLNRVADNAMLAVETWDTTERDALLLAELCRALIHSMTGGTHSSVPVYRVTELAGPGRFPDPLSDSPRFTFTVQVAMRGTALESA